MNPLGPLSGKSFATSISPWIVTLEALQSFKSATPPRNPDIMLQSYLRDNDPLPTFKFDLRAEVKPTNTTLSSLLCESSFSSMYWTLRDLVVQQTANGCSLRTGDLLGTGTISGADPGANGCLLELAAKGGIDVKNKNGEMETRLYFEDGETVLLSAYAGSGVGFGDCVGTILPAK